jgi:hypothetical protein
LGGVFTITCALAVAAPPRPSLTVTVIVYVPGISDENVTTLPAPVIVGPVASLKTAGLPLTLHWYVRVSLMSVSEAMAVKVARSAVVIGDILTPIETFGGLLSTITRTLPVAVPPCPSLTNTVMVYVPCVVDENVAVFPLPVMEPPLALHWYVRVSPGSKSEATAVKVARSALVILRPPVRESSVGGLFTSRSNDMGGAVAEPISEVVEAVNVTPMLVYTVMVKV